MIFYINIINMDKIKDKLYDYQIEHTNNLVRIIKTNNTVLDASDTGTGKTYCAIASCNILKLQPMIICPKSVISTWKNVCKIFDVEPLFIVNYELIQRGKINDNGVHRKTKLITIKKIMTKNNINDVNEIIKYEYVWNTEKIKNNGIFIFDEVHKCSEITTNNGKILLAAKNSSMPMIILSATIADQPEKFLPFFYILNFIDPDQVKKHNITFFEYINMINKWIYRDHRPMVRIHNMLYPTRGSRMRIDVLGDMFPETQITATPYTMGSKREKEIELEYKKLAIELDDLKEKSKKDKGGILSRIVRAHQKIELLKIPTFIELANDFLHNGFNVVIFVNFTKTLEQIAEMLHTKSVIHGQQTQIERDNIILDFQNNKTNIIVANIKAGGLGISLHDIHGGHPRISLISPTWSSIDLTQALGRIHRAGSKTKSLQRIVYCANTVEEKIADKLKIKLKNINSINNGDLDLSNIKFLSEHKNM